MFFKLKELPFELDALEPHISAETVEYHYGKHHLGYVNKLNDLVEGTEFEKESLEEIIKSLSGDIFDNAAQVWNHDFYWEVLTPNKKDNIPKKLLLYEIEKRFGTYNAFENIFKKAALSHFGSGWAWLIKNQQGELEIVSTDNAKNPLVEGNVPLLVCDLWEHAYYIDYRNDRKK